MITQRSLDLIREILLEVERFEPKRVDGLQTLDATSFSGSPPQNHYHIELLVDAGFLKAKGPRDLGTGAVSVSGMTMRGHDFLDAVRDSSIWETTKNRVRSLGGWTLEIVLAVAVDELKRRLNGLISG